MIPGVGHESGLFEMQSLAWPKREIDIAHLFHDPCEELEVCRTQQFDCEEGSISFQHFASALYDSLLMSLYIDLEKADAIYTRVSRPVIQG